MPRPSTTDSLDTSHDLQQRLNPPTSSTPSTPTATINVPLIINNPNQTDVLANSNSSLIPSTSTRLIQHHSLISDKKTSNIHVLSIPKQHNDSTTSTNDLNKSSSNCISIHRNNPLISSNSRPAMEDKSIQCIDDNENSTANSDQITKSNLRFLFIYLFISIFFFVDKKRNRQSSDESWTVAADT
jgi:hypothetical protein